MSANSNHIYCGIFTENKEKAKQIIDYIKDNRDKSTAIVYFNNIDSLYLKIIKDTQILQYKWIKPSSSTRGNRFHSAYIDLNLPLKIINENVLPFCVYTKPQDLYTFDTNKNKMDLDTMVSRLIKIKTIYGNIKNINIYDGRYTIATANRIMATHEDVVIGN